eukprot:TRINITY_DN23290_c0_g1_i1.p1 TRINITY_DN23290_c0_g1~~TRINITY_DN23290_c0_g1_i1.p1  ORF type:complete len:322 (-),score=43.39 TRINITY_DN23290_c0_g1_i1:109-1074(-)
MSPPLLGSFDASRGGSLLDAQYDAFGRRLATASSDGVVRLWSTEQQNLLAELRAHQAPVVILAWAPERTSSPPLASGSSDGSVCIWREGKDGQWRCAHQYSVRGVVTGLAFCPAEYNLLLLAVAGGSSGEVSMMLRKEISASAVLPASEHWQAKPFKAHENGIISMAWAPGSSPATLAAGPAASRAAPRGPRRLVTAGTDYESGKVRIWRCDEKTEIWSLLHEIPNAWTSVLRCVVWRPNVGIPSSTLVVASQDGAVQVWVQDMEGQEWSKTASWTVNGDARRLSWSKAGSLLAVSVGDSEGLLFKEGPVGTWSQAATIEG